MPAVDTVNDAVQTFIRPSMGGLLAAATAGAAELDNSAWMAQHPWVGVLLGVVVAGLVHAGKTTARPQPTSRHSASGAPVRSTVEDGASLSLSLIALFVPVLVIVVLLARFLAALGWLVWRRRSSRRRRMARLGGVTGTRPVATPADAAGQLVLPGRDARHCSRGAAVARRPGRRTDSPTVAPR